MASRGRLRMSTALVELDDVKVWFPIRSGLVLDRQVDARPGDPAALRADRRPHRLRRPGHHTPRRRRAPRAAPAHADGVPGPVRLAQTTAQRWTDRRRAAARA